MACFSALFGDSERFGVSFTRFNANPSDFGNLDTAIGSKSNSERFADDLTAQIFSSSGEEVFPALKRYLEILRGLESVLHHLIQTPAIWAIWTRQ